jgi:hypothetical protein
MPPSFDCVPQETPSVARDREDVAAAGVALERDHPLVTVAWILAAFAIAAGIGPWVSKCIGVTLPAFAIVRTGRRRDPEP